MRWLSPPGKNFLELAIGQHDLAPGRRAAPDIDARYRGLVDEKNAVAHGDAVAWKADDALDEGDRIIVRLAEDDDIAALGRGFQNAALEIEYAERKGEARIAVGEFRDEEEIADLQRRDHGARRDVERLEREGAEQQGKHRGEDERLYRADAFVFLALGLHCVSSRAPSSAPPVQTALPTRFSAGTMPTWAVRLSLELSRLSPIRK